MDYYKNFLSNSDKVINKLDAFLDDGDKDELPKKEEMRGKIASCLETLANY